MSIDHHHSPTGMTVSQHIREREQRSSVYREAGASLAPAEELARMVIICRSRLDLTRGQFAERTGLAPLEIARIERGQYVVDESTRQRIAQAVAGA